MGVRRCLWKNLCRGLGPGRILFESTPGTGYYETLKYQTRRDCLGRIRSSFSGGSENLRFRFIKKRSAAIPVEGRF